MIAGAGFAMMAWKLAKLRAGVQLLPTCFVPDIGHAKTCPLKSSWHYYHILNRAEMAWNNRNWHGRKSL